jgi:DNA-binding beta-propeller fold protein YncE
MKQLTALLLLTCACAPAGTLFCGAYPNQVLVVDEAQGKVIDTITLSTGLPTSLRLSHDKKTIYVTTNDKSGVEVIDVATHKITNHFVLNDATHKFRMQGGSPDPEGKFLYTNTTQITRQIDRYELGKAKYTIIDIPGQKILKTFDQPTETGGEGGEAAAGGGGGGGGGGRGGGGFEVSPDGKYLYQFGAQVTVLKAEDFSLVERIPLEMPDSQAVENLALSGVQEALSDPNQRVSLFNYADPIVHNRVFGLARFDLNKRKFDFTPIGPSPAGMAQLRVAPDQKEAFTVISSGDHGNKRCEFWAIDLATTKLARTAELSCRTRFSFGLSANGKKVYIYGAGYEIDVYDAVSFKKEASWDLGHDMTGGGMIVIP